MITASVVTFHTSHQELIRLIDCVMRSSIERLYIIDNSSNDELRDLVKDYTRIRYIHSLNLGYGSGHNVAIKQSLEIGAKYHIILNPDVYWENDVIKRLTDFMEKNNDCGLVMPKIIYPSGEVQYLCKLVPTPMDLIGRRFIPFKNYHRKHDYYYEMQWMGYNSIIEVPILSGCFMYIRCSILKEVGGFDERYFMYAEDVDLCRRIGEISRTIFYPKVSVIHEYDKGSYKNRKLLKYHISSIIKYFNKWGWFFDKKRRNKNKQCILQIRETLSI